MAKRKIPRQREAIPVSNSAVTEGKQTEEALGQIEWLLTKTGEPESDRGRPGKAQAPGYGSSVELDTCRLLVDSVGEGILTDIVEDFLTLLDTSAAVYEKNGDYARAFSLRTGVSSSTTPHAGCAALTTTEKRWRAAGGVPLKLVLEGSAWRVANCESYVSD